MSSSPYRAGFSLVELMVVIGIVGILVTLAVPRYNGFIANARRGEAKSNLSHISMLQSMYKVEHWQHYYGNAMTSTGIGNGGSCSKTTPGEGLDNHLGFAPANCTELRYLYYLVQSSKTAFAYAASDTQGKHIYPDCSGGYRTAECGKTQGDVVSMTLASGKPEVCRNINKYCPGEAGTPTPCACTATVTRGTELTSLPPDASLYECQTSSAVRQRTDTTEYVLHPPGCVGGVTSCPASTTTLVNYNVTVRGAKPIDQYASTGSNPCNCGAVSPDPRAACRPCACITTPPECPATAPPAIGTTVANTYTCQPAVTTSINQTRTCTPASDPPCRAPFTRTSPLSCSYQGEKVHNCDNLCGAWGTWGAWSECAGGEKQRTRSRTCATSPCAGTSLSCSTTETGTDSNCPTCVPSETTCCDQNDQAVEKPSTCGEGHSWNDTTCACTPLQNPACTEEERRALELCEASKRDIPNCRCIEEQSCSLAEEAQRLLCISPDQWVGYSETSPSCECIEYCPAGNKTVAQDRIDCRATAGMATCPQAKYSFRFNSNTCRCIEPYCKYTQCVINAITSIIGNDHQLKTTGENLRPCYRTGETSFDTALQDAITGGKTSIRTLLSTRNYSSCENSVAEALNSVKRAILEDTSGCDKDDSESVGFEVLDN